MFLSQVKVRNFAESKKSYNSRYGERSLYTYPNKNSDDVFYIVGVTAIKDGVIEYDREYGYQFNQKKSHKVYIVAKSIGRRFKALERDLEIIES